MRESIQRGLKRCLPKRWRPALRRGYYGLQDGLERLAGRRNPLLPPTSLVIEHSIGIGDFERIGGEFLAHFVELCSLRPDERVLEVGCGLGRMALPLTGYLRGDGRYDGFDVDAVSVQWCASHLTPRFPHFRFLHADIYNKEYNSAGTQSGVTYRFPYGDSSFDFCFLTSVFTHLLSRETEHYMGEIARTLNPEGRCLMTFFLLNPESEALIAEGRATLRFAHALDGCRVQDPQLPEAAVAHAEDSVLGYLAAAGMELVGPIHYGKWCRRPGGLSGQDLLVVRKVPAGTH